MKIAVTSSGAVPEASHDPRFGRAAYFMLFDTETNSWECHPNNQPCKSLKLAVMKAAELVIQLGAAVVISGHMGAKARRVLYENNIRLYRSAAPTVQEAVSAFQKGELPEITALDYEKIWK